MFFRPQHMQSLSRHLDARLGSTARAAAGHPFWWGTRDLEVAIKDDDGWRVVVTHLEMYLPNGRQVVFSADHTGPLSEPFRERFAENRAKGLGVWLGVRRVFDLAKTLADAENPLRPFARHRDLVKNDNDGRDPQEITFKAPQIDILFEPDEKNYHLRKIALIVPSEEDPDVPVFDPNFAPEYCLVFGLFGGRLVSETRGVLRELATAVERLSENTSRETLEEESFGGLDARWKLLATAPLVARSKQLSYVLQELHPFDVYLELAQLIGALSIFRTEEFEGLCELPKFNYRSPATGLLLGHKIVRDLIPQIWHEDVEESIFEVDATQPALASARFSSEWLSSEWRVYLGIEKPDDRVIDEMELHTDLREHFKLSPEKSIERIVIQALDGFSIRTLARTPDRLRSKESRIYFEVDLSNKPDLKAQLSRGEVLSYQWVRNRAKHDSLTMVLSAVRKPYAQRLDLTSK